ncbi:MobF family relaxase [Nocardia asiatica]|uniref:MobF family relaxase n=1 Tax=Nocardia asiatica TaxID=209252 RepID=UPI0005C145DE|nr:MobF family relaxase [Nocardia asiatica]
MSLHKLSAEIGLTRIREEVDRSDQPTRWWGSGLAALGIAAGAEATDSQIRYLFGRGMHPNADAIIDDLMSQQLRIGVDIRCAIRYAMVQARLGQAFQKFAEEEFSFRRECARGYAEWNAAMGRAEYATVPRAERTRIRLVVAKQMFEKEHGRPPRTDREISGWIHVASRPPRKATAGYELRCHPVKSVSALLAVAPMDVAEQIEAAHRAAVADALHYLEQFAAFTRIEGGTRQVRSDGLVALAVEHADSLAGDPSQHTHLFVANRVRRPDEQWGALDGRLIYRHNVAASEVYNTRIEHHLEQRLGLVFLDRDAGATERPVREIAGVDPELRRLWSRRHAQITSEVESRHDEFTVPSDIPTTPARTAKVMAHAALITRPETYVRRSATDRRADWMREASTALGGDNAVQKMIEGVLSQPAPSRAAIDSRWIAVRARQVAMIVARSHDPAQPHHFRAEAERNLRGMIAPHHWPNLVVQVADTATELHDSGPGRRRRA